MTARRPLVLAGGNLQQLDPADTLSGVQPLRLRVYLADGSRAYIPLDENGELPITLADGSEDVVPVIGRTYG